MDYEEEFAAGNPRHASVIHVKTGVKKDGTLVAHHMRFIFDSGAYGAFKPNAFLNGPHLCAGPYKIPHVFIEEHMVYTNKIPCGHMRSPGDPQGIFANESQMDLVAKKLGMDPIEFRKKNFMHDGDIDPTGEEFSYIKTDETLKKALEDAGYQKPKGKNVGRGIALVQWTPAGGIGTVAISLDQNGMATISSAMRRENVRVRAAPHVRFICPPRPYRALLRECSSSCPTSTPHAKSSSHTVSR